jgi:outer membrane protein, heavy metal efflux system
VSSKIFFTTRDRRASPSSNSRKGVAPGVRVLRRSIACALLILSFSVQAQESPAAALDAQSSASVQGPHPHPAGSQTGETALSIREAVQLALSDQPILLNREALVAAEEQQAVSAAQLPDPKLSVGLKDLPFDRGEAFSVRDDSFTMFTVGVSQDLPRAEKRRLKGERKRLDAEMDHYGLLNDRKVIERDTALSWLDVYEAEQALSLTHQLAMEDGLQVQSMESGYRSGRNSQADWLAAKVEADLANDKEQDWRHHVERMRAALSRWVGDDPAGRPLAQDLSTLPEPEQLARIVTAIEQHPAVSGVQAQIDASKNEIAQAKQAYKPDFSVEAYVSHRPAYADLVGIQFSFDLPFFTGKRQDPELHAAQLRSQAARDRKEDLLRDLRAQATEDYVDWHHANERAATFEREIIPEAQRRTSAAQSAYAAAKGSFDAVLLARRTLLEIRIQRLALVAEAARAQTRLQYFASTGEMP